jgi:hypothetical protein
LIGFPPTGEAACDAPPSLSSPFRLAGHTLFDSLKAAEARIRGREYRMDLLSETSIEENEMKQPIWIRERTPPAPPPTTLQPVLKRPERVAPRNRGVHPPTGAPFRLLSHVRPERDPAMIEVILMQYRLLLLLFSVSIFKH